MSRFFVFFRHCFERFQIAISYHRETLIFLKLYGSEYSSAQKLRFQSFGQSVTWALLQTLRTWKSWNFAKCYLAVLKTWFLTHFWRLPIEDFRWFSSISWFCFIFLRRFERFKEANCIQIRSFSLILHGSEQFSVQNALGAQCRRSCPPRGGPIRSVFTKRKK